MSTPEIQIALWRRGLLAVGLLGAAVALVFRCVDLQVISKGFLQYQGDVRHLRVVDVPAHRGMITDRHGEPLAISAPVEAVWAHPGELLAARAQWPQLAQALGIGVEQLEQMLGKRQDREFVYLRRQVEPALAQRVMALQVPGVALQREYRRYYPAGEVMAHVLGFTDIDDRGQEGMELAADRQLRGEPGAKRVIKDRLGRVVENVESLRQPNPGQHLALSIDQRLQYLAYRELKAAVQRHNARSGSVVVLDVRSGEVLAMVNQPSFNPNNRDDLQGARYRNRAVTDVFEPGSTLKPFVVAAALDAGIFKPDTMIDTAPGYFMVSGNTIRDIRNYGRIDVATVIQKSSNVGASKIALALDPERFWEALTGVGFGMPSGSRFPGESSGSLTHYQRWRPIERATLSYGYGLSVTPLQLAQAYTVLAGDGRLRPVSFLRVDEPAAVEPLGDRVYSERTVAEMRRMLEAAISREGTGFKAHIPGYRVAGKTGTVRKSGPGGYLEDRYISVFVGMAPASAPRVVAVVMINEPQGDEYYGGVVAAPVFSEVVGGALRLLNVAPDDLPALGARMALLGDR